MALCYKRSRRLSKIIVAIVVTLLVSFFCMRQSAIETFDLVLPLEAHNESTEFVDGKCVLPVVDPFRTDVMMLVRKLSPIKCNGKKRYGKVVEQELQLDVSGLIKVEMKYIRRPDGDDFNVEFSEAIQVDLTSAGKQFRNCACFVCFHAGPLLTYKIGRNRPQLSFLPSPVTVFSCVLTAPVDGPFFSLIF